MIYYSHILAISLVKQLCRLKTKCRRIKYKYKKMKLKKLALLVKNVNNDVFDYF